MTPGGSIVEGLYESLITRELLARLTGRDDLTLAEAVIDDADQPEVLSRHVRDAVRRALAARRTPEDRLALVNRVVQALADPDAEVVGARQLLSAVRPAVPGISATYDTRRPATPLSDTSLLTNAVGEPAIGAELRAELPSADSVDAIIAFVKWYGLRVIEPELRRLAERGVPLRVITTTYMGATERQALDRLVPRPRRPGAHPVRRPAHPAAREGLAISPGTGFDTAYVGSANLSQRRPLDGVGVERQASASPPRHVIDKFAGTFESYWADAEFEAYDPDATRTGSTMRWPARRERGAGRTARLALSGSRSAPYPYQAEMLDAARRSSGAVHDRHGNLVVAATGTGKTVDRRARLPRLCTRAGVGCGCCSSRTARRSSTSRCARTARSSRTPRSASCTSTARGPSAGEHVFASVQIARGLRPGQHRARRVRRRRHR